MSKRKRRRVKRQAPNLKCDTTPKKEKTWCACQQQVQLPKGGVGHHKGNVGRITFQSGKEPFIPIPTHHPPFSHLGIRDGRPSALHASPSGLGSHGKHLQQRVIRKQRRLVCFLLFSHCMGQSQSGQLPTPKAPPWFQLSTLTIPISNTQNPISWLPLPLPPYLCHFLILFA